MRFSLDSEELARFSVWFFARCPSGVNPDHFYASFEKFAAGKVMILRVKSLPENKTMVEMGCLDD